MLKLTKKSLLVFMVMCLVTPLLQAAEKPNVVIIYGDDVGYGDVGAYGSKLIPTPNIDTLAFQTALVGLVYVVTYGFIRALGSLFDPEVASILWGFFFFFGLIFAFIIRWLMKKIGM